jgi:hypothetical protein
MTFRLRDELPLLAGIAIVAAAIFGPLLLRPVTCVNGGAATRYAAQVPGSLRQRYLDARRMRVGIGSAAIGTWDSLGDAVAVNGLVYLRTTYPASPNYYRLVANRYFQSNDFVWVSDERVASVRWRIPAVQTAAQLLETLAQRYPGGVIAAGYVRFAELRTIAIAQPAAGALPILPNAASYYTRPMEVAHDQWTYVVALALPANHRNAERLLPPGGKTSGIAYALRLADIPVDMKAPPETTEIGGLGQIVGDSAMAEGQLDLYPVGRLEECEQ